LGGGGLGGNTFYRKGSAPRRPAAIPSPFPAFDEVWCGDAFGCVVATPSRAYLAPPSAARTRRQGPHPPALERADRHGPFSPPKSSHCQRAPRLGKERRPRSVPNRISRIRNTPLYKYIAILASDSPVGPASMAPREGVCLVLKVSCDFGRRHKFFCAVALVFLSSCSSRFPGAPWSQSPAPSGRQRQHDHGPELMASPEGLCFVLGEACGFRRRQKVTVQPPLTRSPNTGMDV
jgi:hypothetical protein